MGIRVTIDGIDYPVEGYDVDEAATPIAAGDTSGHVGTISFTTPSIPRPHLLIGDAYELHDTRKGFMLGTIDSVNINRHNGNVTFTGPSRMGQLNIYNVRAEPYVGTLGGAIEYYLSLANIEHQYRIDDSIKDRPVVLQGWLGELWYYLKMLAVAQDCDIALVSGVIVVRPIRIRETELGREIAADISVGGESTAQAVEVARYNNRAITNGLVYPVGGWNDDTPIISVSAGERMVQEIEINASLSSVQQPVMKRGVPRHYSQSSEFCITNDEGNIVDPDAWDRAGGELYVEIGEDTKTLILTIKAPDLMNTKKGPIRTYSLAYGKTREAENDWERWGSLRIFGTGVAFKKEEVRVSTALSKNQTDDEVGETINNPFISTTADVYRTGLRAAARYGGLTKMYGGEVVSINRRGDTGMANYPLWDEVIDATGTWEQVAAGLASWGEITDHWYSFVRDRYENQVFGNVTGSRVWNRDTQRWYRIREAKVTASTIRVEQAEDDTLWEDFMAVRTGIETWADYRDLHAGISTWGKVELIGLGE